MPLLLKMTTPQHRSSCVMHFDKKESVTAVQRAFRTQLHYAVSEGTGIKLPILLLEANFRLVIKKSVKGLAARLGFSSRKGHCV